MGKFVLQILKAIMDTHIENVMKYQAQNCIACREIKVQTKLGPRGTIIEKKPHDNIINIAFVFILMQTVMERKF